MPEPLEDLLRRTTIFRRLSPDDRQRLAAVARVREFDKGATLFSEGDASDSLQEIADMIGTTIETSIRIMSRWGKQDIVRTEQKGFVIVDRAALESVAMS